MIGAQPSALALLAFWIPYQFRMRFQNPVQVLDGARGNAQGILGLIFRDDLGRCFAARHGVGVAGCGVEDIEAAGGGDFRGAFRLRDPFRFRHQVRNGVFPGGGTVRGDQRGLEGFFRGLLGERAGAGVFPRLQKNTGGFQVVLASSIHC